MARFSTIHLASDQIIIEAMKTFLTGLATGLAIGYMTAPRSGKLTRNQLGEAASNLLNRLSDQWAKTTTQVNKLIHDTKEQAGLYKSEPNLFADMEAGKLDKYKDENQRPTKSAKNKHNPQADDATWVDGNKMEEALN